MRMFCAKCCNDWEGGPALPALVDEVVTALRAMECPTCGALAEDLRLKAKPKAGEPDLVAYNFSEEHADNVEKRLKKRTLRTSPRAKVGDRLQLYTRQRTRYCRKLSEVDPVCTMVGEVHLEPTRMGYNGHWQDPSIIDDYARADGFADYPAMYAWFKAKYGEVPYTLYETRWDWPEASA